MSENNRPDSEQKKDQTTAEDILAQVDSILADLDVYKRQFDIRGGKEAAFKFIDKLQIFSLLANVADVKSLVIHPATTTHSQLTAEELEDQGIHQGTIRLSIGTENINDILADLEQAFN